MGRVAGYSVALAYELISQFRQTSSKAGAVHSMIPPQQSKFGPKVLVGYPSPSRKATAMNPPSSGSKRFDDGYDIQVAGFCTIPLCSATNCVGTAVLGCPEGQRSALLDSKKLPMGFNPSFPHPEPVPSLLPPD